jgi:hypothetical protein
MKTVHPGTEAGRFGPAAVFTEAMADFIGITGVHGVSVQSFGAAGDFQIEDVISVRIWVPSMTPTPARGLSA